MKDKMNWLKWPLEHYSISLLIIGILFVLGIYGMYVMPKDEFPAFTIRQGVVVAVYPGATSEEVEQQVARPLERYLFTYGEVNREKTTTTSQNGMCIVMVRLNDDVNNKDEVWSKIKHGLNTFKPQLPSGVLAIVVNDDFGNTSALLISIESPERSYRELKQYSDDLSDRLRRIPSVANVKLFGEQKEQISLYIDRQRLQAYGIGQQMLFSRLQAQGITTMSGSISDDDQQIPIHIEATENSEEEIANQIIYSDAATGKVARVRDIARVVREYEPRSSRIKQNGHSCMLISMEMTPGNNVVQYGREVDKVNTGGNAITKWVQNTYNYMLAWTFRHPWLTIGGGLGIILLSTVIATTLKIRLFPYADRDQFAVEIFLPDGKGLAETELIADSVQHVLEKDKRITGITSFIGCSSPRFMDAYAPQMAGNNFAQFIVNTKSNDATLDLLAKYQPQLSEAFPNAYVKFKRMDYLEVNELEYRFYGDNLDSLHVVAERLMERMRQMPELEWVHTDYFQPYPIINVELDPVTSAQLGITRTTAQLALSATSSNLRVGQIWERQRVGEHSLGMGNYELPIVVKDDADMTYADVEDLGILSPATILAGGLNGTNTTVPLRQIAKVKPKWSESRIMHRGGERCITVTGQFAQGVYTAQVEKEIARIMQNEIQIPQGVRSEVGGEIEYGNEALPQIASGLIIAWVIVFFFLLFNFKKYGITIVCMAALILMIPGTLVGLGLINRALGLSAIFGLITLMGMIMRNEILIFEHAIDLLRSEKEKVNSERFAAATPEERKAMLRHYNECVKQAAYDAGKRRMVPIFLTTATTAVGVVPMIIAQSSIWMPVGVTIFAGGIGALILVVTMLPVIYWKVSTK